mmetsp:Transcript_26403/g.60868  ORF Transcript_26403/g.60868 Transcript_26403/m.60868 type:complete len:510 (-) Transcript_26403:49-1578(-)
MVEPTTDGDCQVAELDDGKQVVCASDHGSRDEFGFCYLATSGSSSMSSPLELGLQYTVAVSSVSRDVALLCSAGSPDSKPGECQLLDASGSSVQKVGTGRAVELGSEVVVDISTEVLNYEDHIFACCYLYQHDDGTKLACKTLTVATSEDQLQTGDAIHVGNEDEKGDPVSSISLAQLDNDKVLLCWTRLDGGVFATVLESTGASLRSSEEYRLTSLKGRSVSSAPVYLDEALVCWNSNEDGKWDQIHCCNMIASSSSTLTSGGVYLLRHSINNVGSMAMTALGARDGLLCYMDQHDQICSHLRASGVDVLAGEEHIDSGKDNSQLSLARLSDSSAYVCAKPPLETVSCRTISNLGSNGNLQTLSSVGNETTTSTEMPWGWPWWAWLFIVLIPCLCLAMAGASAVLLRRSRGKTDSNGNDGQLDLPLETGKKERRKDRSSRDRDRNMRETSYDQEPPSVPRGRNANRGGFDDHSKRFGENTSPSSSGSSSGSEDEQRGFFGGFGFGAGR